MIVRFANRIGRRELIGLMAGIFALPVAARGQEATDRTRRLSVLSVTSADDPIAQARTAVLNDTLAALDWREGVNLRVDWRNGNGDRARISDFAAELVALEPDVILAVGTPCVAELKRRTATIPIVFAIVTDPVGQGLVASLSQPGGIISGFSDYDGPMAGKWLEMLTQITPRVARAAVLYNPATAPFAGLMLRASGLLVLPDFFTLANREPIVRSAASAAVPAVYWSRAFVADGGLMSYSTDTADLLRRAALYVDRILKGAQVSALPVQNPTKFDLTVNLKTAASLGVTLSPSLLAIANEVIE